MFERSGAATGIKPTVQTGRWPGQFATWAWETVTAADFTPAPAMALEGASQRDRQLATGAYRRSFLPKHLKVVRAALVEEAREVLDGLGGAGVVAYVPPKVRGG